MITTTARDLKIALLEARQRELVEASKIEVINTDQRLFWGTSPGL